MNIILRRKVFNFCILCFIYLLEYLNYLLYVTIIELDANSLCMTVNMYLPDDGFLSRNM
jgi:hypothetical protein